MLPVAVCCGCFLAASSASRLLAALLALGEEQHGPGDGLEALGDDRELLQEAREPVVVVVVVVLGKVEIS